MNEKEIKAKIQQFKDAIEKFKAAQSNPSLSTEQKKSLADKIPVAEAKIADLEAKLAEATGGSKDKPADKPKDEPTKGGGKKPKAKDKPKDKPADKPKDKPADKPKDKTTGEGDTGEPKPKDKKPKATPKKKPTKKGKLPRHVFEYDHEQDGKKGIFRYIIQAETKEAAEKKNKKDGKWVKVVTKGRSPLVGFVEDVVKGAIGRPKTRVTKYNYLFEKETDTTVSRKVVTATSEAKAKEAAPEGYEFKRQLKGSGRLPKEGTFQKVKNRKGKTVVKTGDTPKKDKATKEPAKKLSKDEIRIGGKVYKKGSKEACDALVKSYEERRKNAAAASKSRQAANNKSRNVRKATNVGNVIKKLVKIEFSTSKKTAENYEKLIKGLTDNKADIIAKGKAFIKAMSILSDYNPQIAEKEVKKAIDEMIADLKEKLAAKKKQKPSTPKAQMRKGGTAGLTYHVVGGDDAPFVDYDSDTLEDALDYYDSLAPAERYNSMVYSLNRKGYPVATYRGEGMYKFGGDA